jgi:CMP-N-acetylneuraminic acid synthetase
VNVLGIVPARTGSKRLPGKNVCLLGGKPLVVWAVEAAHAARRLSRVVVSSDDDKILALATDDTRAIPLRRPADLAGDTSPAIDFVRHALETLEAAGHDPFDAVAIVQPSSPLTLAEDIDATVALLERTGADSAVSVVHVAHDVHPAKFKVLRGDRLLPYLEEEEGRMAAHDLPDVYVRNGAVYVSRRHVIDAGRIIGADCRAHVMPRERSVDVNDEMDLRFAEFLLAARGGLLMAAAGTPSGRPSR